MPNEEIKRPASSLPNAGKGRVICFVNESGTPSIKDENGVETPSATLVGDPLKLNEVAAPAPVANTVQLYAKDLGGATVMYYIDDSGAEVILAGRGQTLIPLWKGDTPGNPFVDTDVVGLSVGDRAMYDCPAGDVVTFNFPPSTPGNVGQRVGIHYTTAGPKNPGQIVFSPNGTDSIESRAAGQDVQLVPFSANPSMEFESDGNGRWNCLRLLLGADEDFANFP